MKKLYALIIFGLLFFSSCTKNTSSCKGPSIPSCICPAIYDPCVAVMEKHMAMIVRLNVQGLQAGQKVNVPDL